MSDRDQESSPQLLMGLTNPRQLDRLLRYLEDYGTITPLEALRDLGIMRLGERETTYKLVSNQSQGQNLDCDCGCGEKWIE